jgi:hypothetical protein
VLDSSYKKEAVIDYHSIVVSLYQNFRGYLFFLVIDSHVFLDLSQKEETLGKSLSARSQDVLKMLASMYRIPWLFHVLIKKLFQEGYFALYASLCLLVYILYKYHMNASKVSASDILLSRKEWNSFKATKKRYTSSTRKTLNAYKKSYENNDKYNLFLTQTCRNTQPMTRYITHRKKRNRDSFKSIILRNPCESEENAKPFKLLTKMASSTLVQMSHNVKTNQDTPMLYVSTPLDTIQKVKKCETEMSSKEKNLLANFCQQTDLNMESSWSTPYPVEPSQKRIHGLPFVDPKCFLFNTATSKSKKNCIVIWSPSENLWETETDDGVTTESRLPCVARTPHILCSSEKNVKDAPLPSNTKFQRFNWSAHRKKAYRKACSLYEYATPRKSSLRQKPSFIGHRLQRG